MHCAIRVDSSKRIGSGHLVRCITLAKTLRSYGIRVDFIVRENDGNINSRIMENGFNYFVIGQKSNEKCIVEDADYAAWLGVSESDDAISTIKVIAQKKYDWLVVDHYSLSIVWEKKVQPYVKHLLVIDDLSNRRHSCDLLLDQNIVADEEKYKRLTTDRHVDTPMLLGPRFALLDSRYVAARADIDRYCEDRRLLKTATVFFGGYDGSNVLGKTLHAFMTDPLRSVELDVVLGPEHPCKDEIESLACKRGNTTLYERVESLSELLVKSSFAVGGGGTTVWERMCLFVPSVVISIAKNQIPVCKRLGADGYISYIGHYEEATKSSIGRGVKQLLSDKTRIKDMALRGAELVDGKGATRVVEKIIETSRGLIL